MKKLFLGFFAAAFLCVVSASAQSFTVTMTTPSAATTVTANSSGVETSGPVFVNVYESLATITAGVASCPTALSSYTLLTGSGVASTTSAANGVTYTTPSVTVGSTYCIAVTDQFQAGGGASEALISAPAIALAFGTASAPTNLTVTFVP